MSEARARGMRSAKFSRRSFLKLGALAATGIGLGASQRAGARTDAFTLEEATISGMQEAMGAGVLTAYGLASLYLERISDLDQQGPTVNTLLELNQNVLAVAADLDAERAAGILPGPLHGVPIILKDNVDTTDMTTTAGSLALASSVPGQDATVAARLREAGAVIMGKANLSEWANFRSEESSSSGSASSVAANLAAASLGTETDGSILCPGAFNSVVGIKPTVGLTSRAGVIPISASQDTVGPFARTVADAAVLLGALTGLDPRDGATLASSGNFFFDYTQFLDPYALQGARIGVARDTYFGYSPEADGIAEAAIEVMREAGAEVIDPADIETAAEMQNGDGETTVLLYEFKDGINRYLSTLAPGFPRTLEELIAFNEANEATVMPYFRQSLFKQAQEKGPLTETAYREALEESRRLSREEGIDATMEKHGLDAIIAPSSSLPFKIDLEDGDDFLGGSSQAAAMAGYPAITVPAGYSSGLPVGLTFMGRAFSEPALIDLAYAFEQATGFRRVARFLPTADTGASAGTLPETGGSMKLLKRLRR